MFSLDTQKFRSIKAWELHPEESSYAPPGTSNLDLDPVPIRDRTWKTADFVYFWLSDSMAVSTWMMGSSLVALGLSIKWTMAAILIAHILIALPITLQGIIGATLHTPFPIQARSSFGHHLAKFPVVSRIVLACVWFGVQCYTGSECMRQCIIALSPSFRTAPNHLPASANITSAGLGCYVLFWVLQLPFLLIHPTKIKLFFKAKSILVPSALFGLFVWALVKVGPHAIFQQNASNTVRGSALAWAFLAGLNNALGNMSTVALSLPDFARYARRRQDTLVQLVIVPVCFTLTTFVGVTVSQAGMILYGEFNWDPTHLIDHFADDAKGRAARFFVALTLAYATAGTNYAANAVGCAADLSSLFPRYINIQRGAFIASVLGGWAITPWNILAGASSFLAFMGGYVVFLAPFIGILVADYFLVRKGKIDVPSLYLGKEGRYYYTAGCNWRAVVALLCTVPATLPGLIHAISPGVSISEGLENLYSITWLYGITVAAFTYTVCSLVFPNEHSFVSKARLSLDDELAAEQDFSHNLPSSGAGDVLEKEGDEEEDKGDGDREKEDGTTVVRVLGV